MASWRAASSRAKPSALARTIAAYSSNENAAGTARKGWVGRSLVGSVRLLMVD